MGISSTLDFQRAVVLEMDFQRAVHKLKIPIIITEPVLFWGGLALGLTGIYFCQLLHPAVRKHASNTSARQTHSLGDDWMILSHKRASNTMPLLGGSSQLVSG